MLSRVRVRPNQTLAYLIRSKPILAMNVRILTQINLLGLNTRWGRYPWTAVHELTSWKPIGFWSGNYRLLLKVHSRDYVYSPALGSFSVYINIKVIVHTWLMLDHFTNVCYSSRVVSSCQRITVQFSKISLIHAREQGSYLVYTLWLQLTLDPLDIHPKSLAMTNDLLFVTIERENICKNTKYFHH